MSTTAVDSARLPQTISRFWIGLASSVTVACVLSLAWLYTPGQDHFGAIPRDGDTSWFLNYEVGYEIQDPEILFHEIGHSIENARRADIIFLGSSRILFSLDRQLLEAFERKHSVRMFNLGLAGVQSGEVPLRIIRKVGLHPKMWIINADLDVTSDYRSGFFYRTLTGRAVATQAGRAVDYTRLHALKDVIGRNIRWRLKKAASLLHPPYAYRSATNGSWDVDNWIYYERTDNPRIALVERRFIDGAYRHVDRKDESCPADPNEVKDAAAYRDAIGGALVLIQVPSTFACSQRVHEIAAALGVPAFTVDPTQFTSIDGGGHLDGISARNYSTMLFEWLERQPEFRRLAAR